MAKVYSIQNSLLPTTAAPVSQPTGSLVRTMLQLQAGSTDAMRIIEWGISFDGSAAATPGKVELFGTSVAATMSTQFAITDVTKYNDPNAAASNLTVGAATNSGFATTAVTEGTVANYRLFDMQLIAPTNQYVKQFPLGREPEIAVSQFLRVRVTFAVTVNAYIYVVWEE